MGHCVKNHWQRNYLSQYKVAIYNIIYCLRSWALSSSRSLLVICPSGSGYRQHIVNWSGVWVFIAMVSRLLVTFNSSAYLVALTEMETLSLDFMICCSVFYEY